MNVIQYIEQCIMLDTVGFTVDGINATLPRNMKVNDDPSWSTGHMSAPSGKRSFTVRHVKKRNRLRVEGSAAAYFQGHNIVASNDLVMTVVSMLKAVKDTHNIPIPLREAYELVRGHNIAVTRVDTPAMLRVPDTLSRAAVVNGLALAGLRCGINVSLYQNETFYFDQHSQVVALKGYLKDVEMNRQTKKSTPAETENTAALLELASSTIRIEPVYRQKYFKAQKQFEKTPPTPRDLSPMVLARMFAALLDKYNLQGSIRSWLTDEELWAIPRQLRATVRAWQHGHDLLKEFGGNQRALDRHRYILKKQYSIDIDEIPPGEIEESVEVGEILNPANFVVVPDVLRRDTQLFHTLNVRNESNGICDRLDIRKGSIGRVFVDPYEEPDAPDVPDLAQLPDFPPI